MESWFICFFSIKFLYSLSRSSFMDYLQRIRDLALRSMNGLSSASDKKYYQNEINQLKEGIQSMSKTTSLNEQKLRLRESLQASWLEACKKAGPMTAIISPVCLQFN